MIAQRNEATATDVCRVQALTAQDFQTAALVCYILICVCLHSQHDAISLCILVAASIQN